MSNLPTSQRNEWTPSLQEREARADHRGWIGGRIVTLLSHYWRDDDDDALTAAIAADWADVLEGMPQDCIRKACIQYMREEPRRKPTPAAIYALAKGFIPLPVVVRQERQPEEKSERCSKEAAQRMCEEAGYTPKRFGGDE